MTDKPKKLDELYRKLDDKAKADKKDDVVKQAKAAAFSIRTKMVVREGAYLAIISVCLGFVLWAWFPSEFSFFRSLALGIIFIILFSELNLHKMFQRPA